MGHTGIGKREMICPVWQQLINSHQSFIEVAF